MIYVQGAMAQSGGEGPGMGSLGMRRILISIVLVALLAAGAYYGVSKWVQARAEQEVDAAFANMRAAGLTAAHGGVGFDLLRRTLSVNDVVIESSKWSMNVRAPKVELIGLSMPQAPAPQANKTGDVAEARAALAALEADAIVVPRADIALQTALPGAAGKPAHTVDISYAISGIMLRGVHDRRVANFSIERTGFKASSSAPEVGNFSGELTKWTTSDVDLDTLLATFDPAERNQSGPFRRVYGPISAGPATFEFEQGVRVTIDGFAGDAFEVQPGKYNLAAFLEMMQAAQAAGGTPSPAQLRDFADRLAGFYEGLRMGRMEARGINFAGPQGVTGKIEAVRFSNFDGGRLGEMSVENLDVRRPQQEPVVMARFTLTGLNAANSARIGGALAEQGRVGRELSARPLPVFDGFAVSGLRVPMAGVRDPVLIDTYEFSWSDFLGPVPTHAATKLKLTAPLVSQDAELSRMFAAAGATSISGDFDLGAGWTEASKTLSLAPIALDLKDWFSVHAAVSLGNVPRDAFTIDPNYAAKMQILMLGMEAGPVEFTLRDAGGLDRAIAVVANEGNISPAQARAELLDGFKQSTADALATHPELAPVLDAVTNFLQAPKGTLSVKIVPKGHVPMALLALAMRVDPLTALNSFTIEATTTR